MAANGVLITNTTTVTWDGVSTRLLRGQVLDSPSAGGLLSAIGSSNYVALTSQQQAGSPGVDNDVYRGAPGSEPYNPGQN